MINLKYHSKKYLFALILLLILVTVTCILLSAALQKMVTLPESPHAIDTNLPNLTAKTQPIMPPPIKRLLPIHTPSNIPLPLPVPVTPSQINTESPSVSKMQHGMGASPLATPTPFISVESPSITHTVVITATAFPTATPFFLPTLTETATQVPTATNTPKPGVVHQCGQVIEAETAKLTGLMQVGADSSASGGRYVHVPNGTAERSVINNDKMTFNLNLGQAGNYQFMGYIYGNNSGADSFFVQVDRYPTNGFIWEFQSNLSYQGAVIIPRGSNYPFEIKLEAGSHQLEIMLREDGARLDKIQLICVN